MIKAKSLVMTVSNVVVKVSLQTSPATAPYSVLGLVSYLHAVDHNSQKRVRLEFSVDLPADVGVVAVEDDGKEWRGANDVARYLARSASATTRLYGWHDLDSSQVDYWCDYGLPLGRTTDFKVLSSATDVLNHHLALRSFFVGHTPTAADFLLWGTLKNNAMFARNVSISGMVGPFLLRWFSYINNLPFVTASVAQFEQERNNKRPKKQDQGQFDIPLPGAQTGKVVTRFPPEPSGYLHIGHAKAALLNDYFARLYKGKLIVRFDDTNPAKEKVEFEESIKEDLLLIGIKGDVISHTSDYFEQLNAYAIELIKRGKGYVDDTDQETMRAQRMDGIESKARGQSVEENLALFAEMCSGTERGLKFCLRAKIDMSLPNKAMRDPVMFRCNLLPHHRTGQKYKAYPTYDFACPIVDSLEGVTHALRTNEYRDRNPLYEWVLESLSLRKVHIWDYSRMNFVYTLLSKRKLQSLVDHKTVTGWDDPRFPTIRGIRRRGMTIEGLRQYILMQGASEKQMLLEWDKIWAINKKVIDPTAARHTAIVADRKVLVNVVGAPNPPLVEDRVLYKKNPSLGKKKIVLSSRILLEQEDAAALEQGEEVTLMDWGNAVVEKVERDGHGVTLVNAKLNLQGDFKATKKKLTWLSDAVPEPSLSAIPATLKDYDYLITKPKLEEEDKMEDYLTKVTEFSTDVLVDANIANLKRGDIIQFERKGYYICDRAYSKTGDKPVFIYIPDGKAAGIAAKSASN